ncbi:unnamed protein product, partial [Allacma fusca]
QNYRLLQSMNKKKTFQKPSHGQKSESVTESSKSI